MRRVSCFWSTWASRRPKLRGAIACLAVLCGVLAAASLVGCGSPSSSAGILPSSSASTSIRTNVTTAGTSTVSSTVSSIVSSTTASTGPVTSPSGFSVQTPQGRVVLTSQQLAGQRVIYSYSGLTPPDDLLALIRAGEVAGVIFFADNISTSSQIRAVTTKLQLAAQSPQNPVATPLLLMVDQEGGHVRRLPGEPLLSQKQIAAAEDPSTEAARAGTLAGRNLVEAGMNVNLAPVLDVYREDDGFAGQYGRSYSGDPAVVSALGAEFIRAQQAEGVAATAKHFPGLGVATASENTDLRPVTLKTSLAALRSIDEFPYQAAIEAGVCLVMTSWAIYPVLSEKPAGFASVIVKGELRQRLGFEGVTITDALGAGALEAFGTFGQRAVLAAEAGMDLLLCSGGGLSVGVQAKEELSAALIGGRLQAADFQRSAQRVVDLRFWLDNSP